MISRNGSSLPQPHNANRFPPPSLLTMFSPKHVTKARPTVTSHAQHQQQATPAQQSVQRATDRKKYSASLSLLRQMYAAAKFKKWKYQSWGWTKWKDLCNFERLKAVWEKMNELKKIANVNKSLSLEVQELCAADQARFFLHDSSSGMLFSQANPEDDPLITTVGGRGIVGYVAETKTVMRYRRIVSTEDPETQHVYNRTASKAPTFPFVVSGKIPAKSLYDKEVDSSIQGGMDGTNNGLVVPILSGLASDPIESRGLIGVCQVINRFENNFSDDDVSILENFMIFARDHVLEKESQGDVRDLLKAAEAWKIDQKNKANLDKLYFNYVRNAIMREGKKQKNIGLCCAIVPCATTEVLFSFFFPIAQQQGNW